jgi:3-dehydroquinate synthetase
LGLLKPLPELDPEAVMAALRLDKKRQETGVPFVLLPRLGETVIKDEVPMDLVAEVLKEMLGGG